MIRRFNRFELKYVIPLGLADEIRRALGDQMTPDAHGAEGLYRVTSLYYDSPDFVCFHSKVDGIKYRRKVRIRTYGRYASPKDVVALEIKQRINRTVQKRRLMLPVDQATALIADHVHPEVTNEEDLAVIREVDVLAQTLRLKPACVISYLRNAWVGSRYEPGLRITFDRALTARPPDRGLGEGVPEVHFMAPTEIILEVKADEAVPLWVSRLLARHQCSLQRVSKYCLGLAKLKERGNRWTSC